jgi:hypothetical protein
MRRTSASVVFACPAGCVHRKYPDMEPAGRLICICRTRHREHRLVVSFGLPPPGSTPVLTQNLVIRRGRASRIYAAGATRHLLAVARHLRNPHVSTRRQQKFRGLHRGGPCLSRFGVAMIRTATLPRWSGVLVAVGAPTRIAAVLPSMASDPALLRWRAKYTRASGHPWYRSGAVSPCSDGRAIFAVNHRCPDPGAIPVQLPPCPHPARSLLNSPGNPGGC